MPKYFSAYPAATPFLTWSPHFLEPGLVDNDDVLHVDKDELAGRVDRKVAGSPVCNICKKHRIKYRYAIFNTGTGIGRRVTCKNCPK
jgi:hypothetical protein